MEPSLENFFLAPPKRLGPLLPLELENLSQGPADSSLWMRWVSGRTGLTVSEPIAMRLVLLVSGEAQVLSSLRQQQEGGGGILTVAENLKFHASYCFASTRSCDLVPG